MYLAGLDFGILLARKFHPGLDFLYFDAQVTAENGPSKASYISRDGKGHLRGRPFFIFSFWSGGGIGKTGACCCVVFMWCGFWLGFRVNNSRVGWCEF